MACECGTWIQNAQDLVKVYQNLLREFRGVPDRGWLRELRYYLRDEQWWLRRLELQHRVHCLDEGLSTWKLLQDHERRIPVQDTRLPGI